MFRKLSITNSQEKREEYRKNPIYRIVYSPLWRQRGDDLSPIEVWIEGNNLADSLRGCENADCRIRVQEAFEDLCERYSCFINDDNKETQRSFAQAEHSAMMVSLVAFLLLANVYPEAKGHPHQKTCQSITDVICNISGYKQLYEDTRKEEDEREEHGEFIEVADFIEQISIKEDPLSEEQLTLVHRLFGQFVEGHKYCDLPTKYLNERMIARVSDMNGHCLQPELDLLRKQIKEVEVNDGQNTEYRNIIFAKEYEDKISAIRNVIYPYVYNGTDHITPKEQRQWLAIVEPLKLIDGLLIKHDNKPKHKDCTDGEICQQLREFYGNDFQDVDFDKFPKSLSEERKKWKDNGVGLTFKEWQDYPNKKFGKPKYKLLAKVAERVYGEVIRVIKG